MRYPTIFTAAKVKCIIEAVRGRAQVPGLDIRLLGIELDRFAFWYNVFDGASRGRGPYGARPKERWKGFPRSLRPLRWWLGPESTVEWAAREHLAKIFEPHFGGRATAQQYQTILKSGDIIQGKSSQYVLFAQAVFDQLGIKGRKGGIAPRTIVRYRKKYNKNRAIK